MASARRPNKRPLADGEAGQSEGMLALEAIEDCIEKRLFIARVPPNTTEEELREVFSQFGQITEIKIIDKVSKNGNIIAFVSFDTWAATHRALEAVDQQVSLDGHRDGQTLACSFAEQTGKVGRGGGEKFAKGHSNSRVFVGSLPEDVREDDFVDIFKVYGQIQYTNLLPPKGKGRMRCGFVTFALWGEALDAISDLHGRPCPGGSPDSEPLTVMLAQPPKGQEADVMVPAAKRQRTSFEGGWQWQSESDRRDEPSWRRGGRSFEQVKREYIAAVEGDASDAECDDLHYELMSLRGKDVARGKGSKGGKGGSPAWRLDEDNAASRQALAPVGVGTGRLRPVGAPVGGGAPVGSGGPPGKGVGVGERPRPRAPTGGDNEERGRLFVSGLPKDCSDQEFQSLIGQLGLPPGAGSELLECRVVQAKGIGYLRFPDEEVAREVIEALDDRRVNGWPNLLSAKWAAPSRKAPGARDNVGDKGAGRGTRDESGPVDAHRLFVGQIDWGTSRASLLDIFNPFGRVEDLKFLEDKGIAYVEYEDERAAKRAMDALGGKDVPGVSRANGEGLNIKFANRR